jgi:hypothetical protein
MQLTRNVTFGNAEAYQYYQTSKITEISKQNINHTKNSSTYQNIKDKQNAPHALISRAFSQTTPGAPHDNATLYEDRKAHQVLIPAAEPEKLLHQKPTTPHCAIASPTIATYVSPMIVSSITEAVVLSYLYQKSIISVHFQAMLRCLLRKKWWSRS